MRSLSLKLRLIFVLTVIVGLVGLVGLLSYLSQRGIQSEVAAFSAKGNVDLRDFDLERNRLELEGEWNDSGYFMAREVEVFPGRRRPKLRGSIQSLDSAKREIVMYGQRIQLPRDFDLTQLARGVRAEVTCEVKDGLWIADKISTEQVKASDKIKACASSWDLDGKTPESIQIHGIQVSLPSKKGSGVDSALQDIETVTALSLCLFELRAMAYRLAESHSQDPERVNGLDVEGDHSRDLTEETQLRAARKELEHLLGLAAGGSPAASAASVDHKRWIAALFDKLPELDQHLERFILATNSNLESGQRELSTNLIPFLDREMRPRVNVYLREVQDELGDRARSMETKTLETAELALMVSILATLLAMVLGYLLLRSIREPLGALERAAKRIGAGDLSTRVEVHSRDELGALASAFNRMSERLASTTVSIDNLQNILDSMAGALILLTPERCILSLNHAAAKLLSIEPAEWTGKPFARLCSSGSDSVLMPEQGSNIDVAELALCSPAAGEVLVSFSAAELRSPNGSLQGYVCVAQDLRAQKRIEHQVRSSLKEKELLLREVHHRVKNNMQVISSLLAMQQECTEDAVVIGCLEQGQARIRSMALIHEHLYQSSDLAEADVATYLSLLVSHLALSFGSDKIVQVEQDFEPLTLEIDHALALGLIVNELVSNSFQHAFEARQAGKIRLSLRQITGDRAQLVVADDGMGSRDRSAASGPGTLGLSLVQTLVQQLGGETRIEQNNGLQTTISFPYTRPSRVAQ